MAKASVVKAIRLAHLYFGVFISPAILFFALTGALQTFGLHEPNRAGTYQPPKWLAVLGHLHKKADASVPQRREGGGGPKPVVSIAGGRENGSDLNGRPTSDGDQRKAAGTDTPPARERGDKPGRRGDHKDAGAGGDSSQAPAQVSLPATASASTAEGRGVISSGPAVKQHNTLPMKIFFVIVSLGLFVLTGTGIFMAYTYNRNKMLVTLALVSGVAVPLLLLLF